MIIISIANKKCFRSHLWSIRHFTIFQKREIDEREVGKSIRVWQLIELATLQWSFSWIVPSQQFKNEAIFAAVDRYWIVSVTPGGAWKMIEKVVILALVESTLILICSDVFTLLASLWVWKMPGAMIIKAIFIINFFFSKSSDKVSRVWPGTKRSTGYRKLCQHTWPSFIRQWINI